MMTGVAAAPAVLHFERKILTFNGYNAALTTAAVFVKLAPLMRSLVPESIRTIMAVPARVRG